MSADPIRVVVIDDSAYNRQTITQMLESDPDVRVVARAADGDEGLKLVFQHQPDVVTLDLEMPKMDGFTFLRILMSRRATPVLVISSYAAKENVFKALELGALDFIAKPGRQLTPDLRGISDELLQKVKLVRQLRVVTLGERAQAAAAAAAPPAIPATRMPLSAPPAPTPFRGMPVSIPTVAPAPIAPAPPPAPAPAPAPEPFRVVAIGASTGGPPALQQILAALDKSLPIGLVITQHMPAKFTQAFADRLSRLTSLEVKEAQDGDVLKRGMALIAPGSGSLLLQRVDQMLVVRIEVALPGDRFIPSVDRMLATVADACGADTLAVVLTGMGGDGGRGVRAIKQAGGRVIAEAPETAVIFGMPQEAIATGAVDEILPLPSIPDAIIKFVRRK
jgi:two-component system, chemotaxis family, protein-glutamate methylesterase/glutaminase